MDGWTDGISPHSTELCPLSGPLPKKQGKETADLKATGLQGKEIPPSEQRARMPEIPPKQPDELEEDRAEQPHFIRRILIVFHPNKGIDQSETETPDCTYIRFLLSDTK